MNMPSVRQPTPGLVDQPLAGHTGRDVDRTKAGRTCSGISGGGGNTPVFPNSPATCRAPSKRGAASLLHPAAPRTPITSGTGRRCADRLPPRGVGAASSRSGHHQTSAVSGPAPPTPTPPWTDHPGLARCDRDPAGSSAHLAAAVSR